MGETAVCAQASLLGRVIASSVAPLGEDDEKRMPGFSCKTVIVSDFRMQVLQVERLHLSLWMLGSNSVRNLNLCEDMEAPDTKDPSQEPGKPLKCRIPDLKHGWIPDTCQECTDKGSNGNLSMNHRKFNAPHPQEKSLHGCRRRVRSGAGGGWELEGQGRTVSLILQVTLLPFLFTVNFSFRCGPWWLSFQGS